MLLNTKPPVIENVVTTTETTTTTDNMYNDGGGFLAPTFGHTKTVKTNSALPLPPKPVKEVNPNF